MPGTYFGIKNNQLYKIGVNDNIDTAEPINGFSDCVSLQATVNWSAVDSVDHLIIEHYADESHIGNLDKCEILNSKIEIENAGTSLLANCEAIGDDLILSSANYCTIVNSVGNVKGAGVNNVYFNCSGELATPAGNAQSTYNEQNKLTLDTNNLLTKFNSIGFTAKGIQDLEDCPNPNEDSNGHLNWKSAFGDFHPESSTFLTVGAYDPNYPIDLDGTIRPSDQSTTLGAYEKMIAAVDPEVIEGVLLNNFFKNEYRASNIIAPTESYVSNSNESSKTYVIIDNDLYQIDGTSLILVNANGWTAVCGFCSSQGSRYAYGIKFRDLYKIDGLTVEEIADGPWTSVCGYSYGQSAALAIKNGRLYAINNSSLTVFSSYLDENNSYESNSGWTHASGFIGSSRYAYGIKKGNLYKIYKSSNEYSRKLINDNSEGDWTAICGYCYSSSFYAYGIKNGRLYKINDEEVTLLDNGNTGWFNICGYYYYVNADIKYYAYGIKNGLLYQISNYTVTIVQGYSNCVKLGSLYSNGDSNVSSIVVTWQE